LEKDGLILSYYKDAGGRQRRYYTITERGKKQLSEEKVQWQKFSMAVTKVIGGEIDAFA
jgi:DNA-binding PadR family transcriptional regulator